MVFIQTHSDYYTYPKSQIQKNLFLHREMMKRNDCHFFVFQEGFDHLPSTAEVNYFEYLGIDPSKVNFTITGYHEPRRNYLKKNGWIISIQPGSIKAMIKAMETAIKNDYDRAIYFDHDVQFFNNKAENFLMNITNGTGGVFSKHYQFPETAFFSIAKDKFEWYRSLFSDHYKKPDALIVETNMIMENMLQLDHVLELKGDRYGDWGLPDTFDSSFDYVSQLPFTNYYVQEASGSTNFRWKKSMITTELEALWF